MQNPEPIDTGPPMLTPIMIACVALHRCLDENITSGNEWKWMYVYGIKIAHNYTITPDEAGMPSPNTFKHRGLASKYFLEVTL